MVDLFAGPGGLGEGFSSFMTSSGQNPFKIALSIEKDPLAHRTLELRAFYRQFTERLPIDYWEHLKGKLDRDTLFQRHPVEAAEAMREARLMELGPERHAELRALLAEHSLDGDTAIVIGGPPCQAYSIAGRSRNSAKPEWALETDGRSTLYREYLQVLAEVEPVAFVMENVRGLLSARMHGESVFSRIMEDLAFPRAAVKFGRGGRRYKLVPLAPTSQSETLDVFGGGFEPADFLLRAEQHGVPQARQRVIILGIREDVASGEGNKARLVPEKTRASVRHAFRALPKLRSGVSGSTDDPNDLLAELRQAARQAWFKGVPTRVRDRMKDAVGEAAARRWDRGGEFVRSGRASSMSGGFLNHSSRGHMKADLHRYLFAASWAEVVGTSPTLRDFPAGLLPDHANVEFALTGGNFADRFRVQCWGAPSTTVVSHIAKDGHYYIHPDPAQCRSLTVREAARLQTFPDDYFFCGPRTAQYHQVGNAVPIELARRIAGVVHHVTVNS